MLTHKFSPEKQALTATLFRHLLPFAFCYGLSFGFINWLQANKRFVLCSVAPALIPLTTLGFLMGTGKTLGVWSFIYGTNLGSLLLLAVLIIATATQSDQSLLRPGKLDAATKRLGRESLPLLAGGLLMVGLPVLDQMMAGWLEPGSVAVLNYGEKICSIALSLVACAAGQALFPYLSELVGRRDWAGLKSTTIRYSVLIIGCSLPVVAIFWVTAPSIVKMLFESGAFDGEDTIRVAEVLRYLSLQIPFYIAAVLASRVILALRAGMVILVTTLVNLALNAALNLLLMRTMGVAGLALATACVYLLSAIMLYGAMFYILPRRIRQEPSLQS